MAGKGRVEMMDEIPDGWRFYTADNSIPDKCSVMLIRAGQYYLRWFQLSDEEQEKVGLYVSGAGYSFHQALGKAIEAAKPFPELYKI